MYPLPASNRFNLVCIDDDNDMSIEAHNGTMLECDVFAIIIGIVILNK